MTPYDATFEGLHILFNKENVENTLGEVISKAGLKQLRIAETEKYAHVTFFFNGGREAQFEGCLLYTSNTFVSLTDKALSTVQDIRKLFGTTAVTYRPETVSDTPGHN